MTITEIVTADNLRAFQIGRSNLERQDQNRINKQAKMCSKKLAEVVAFNQMMQDAEMSKYR